jgi:hypothetical protein
MSIKHNRSNQLVSPFRFVIPDGAPAEFRNLGIDSCMRRNHRQKESRNHRQKESRNHRQKRVGMKEKRCRNDRQKDVGMATQLRIMN